MRKLPPMPKEQRPASGASSTRPPSGISKPLQSAGPSTGSPRPSRPPTGARSPSPRPSSRSAKQPMAAAQDPLAGLPVSARQTPVAEVSKPLPKPGAVERSNSAPIQSPKPFVQKPGAPAPPSPRDRRPMPAPPSSADAALPKRAKSSEIPSKKPNSAEVSRRRSGSVEAASRPLKSVPAINDPLLAPKRSSSRGPPAGGGLPAAPPPQAGWAASGQDASNMMSTLTGKLKSRAEQVAADQNSDEKDKEERLLRMLDKREETRIARAVR